MDDYYSTVWVHGTSVHVEYEDRIENFKLKGWGAHFWGEGWSDNWFHFSIPNIRFPLDNDDSTQRPKKVLLKNIYVFYEKPLDFTMITAVHIYDGRKKVKSLDGLPLLESGGNHSQSIDEYNSWEIDPAIEIKHGLGISVGVKFVVPPEASGPADILFTTAGARFVVV
ncbi:hypothetical protein [Candidatus Leptofilum sp.]|uniref:hypothetical protein n=1 Tax=Candidatus Leptofilum sp. TaxID=3241576 RepID=UPI003B5AE351